ncbi:MULTISPECIES: hypothetical protein [Crateriforma]|uniref:hypothetical protein n=1 Tax=Crateriforma TaxID=2714592 RepID=UPI0011B3F1DC|nr:MULTISPECIES: hypothetical protein [Crateriforma]
MQQAQNPKPASNPKPALYGEKTVNRQRCKQRRLIASAADGRIAMHSDLKSVIRCHALFTSPSQLRRQSDVTDRRNHTAV